MLREKLRNKKGFTLIEIIVVIVILAVLMAVAVPSVMSYLNEGDNARYEAQARAVYIRVQTEYAKAYANDNFDPKTASTSLTIAKSKFDGVEVSNIKYSVTANHNVDAISATIKIGDSSDSSKVVKVEANKKVTVDATALSGDGVYDVTIDENKGSQEIDGVSHN